MRNTDFDQSKSGGRRATSYDVAKLAGVSQSAVSRCFQKGASISAKTREKVVKAAQELGYQPNAIARGLITQRSNMVAVLVSSNLILYNPDALYSIGESLSAQSMRLLLFSVHGPDEVDAALDQLWQYQVDGVISASHLSRAQYNVLKQRQIPTVLLNRFFDDEPTDSIWCDPTQSAQDMIDRLVSLEHTRFVMVEGPADSQVNMIRKAAIEKALSRHGLSLLDQYRGDYTYESASRAADFVMRLPERPTAIVCANDMMAMGTIDHLRTAHALSTPHDVSVTGFDGIQAGSFGAYALTTIRQPMAALAQAAVERVLSRRENPDLSFSKRALPAEFVPGASIGRAARS